MSSNLACYGIVTPPKIKISPGMPNAPADFFLPIADNHFLIFLTLMVKGLLI